MAAAVAAVAAVVIGCHAGREAESPLLLEEGGGSEKPLRPAKGAVADNSRCHVCHFNFSDEELSVTHARGGVGCEKCHGASDAHCGDENNITPPDVLYAKSRIIPACLKCHGVDELAHADMHCPVYVAGKTKQVCTACHGEHKMSVRTVRWDKETGKLLPKETATP